MSSIEGGSTLTFRIPLDVISRSVPDIGDFPYLPGDTSWDGPTLFMKGSESKCVDLPKLTDSRYINAVPQLHPDQTRKHDPILLP